jgi:tRNA (mo5U34)-methyltransferase
VSIAPTNWDELIQRLQVFSSRVRQVRQQPTPEISWYPYDTLGSLRNFEGIFRKHWERFHRSLGSGPVLDLGCGDGDMGFFFASFGCKVCAIDNPSTNFNGMKAVYMLRERLGLNIEIRESNLDSQFQLDEGWGLVLLLGLLYHLKNPYSVLEYLAPRAQYLLLSTRIARRTMKGLPIQNEPLAYLLDDGEAGGDPTNFWIFSETGLARILKRTGWFEIGSYSLGDIQASNPADPEADERAFVLLRSGRCSADANLLLLDGWKDMDERACRSTLRQFRLQVHARGGSDPQGFFMNVVVPEVMTGAGPVTLHCAINGQACPAAVYSAPGSYLYRASMPEGLDYSRPMVFDFAVDHRPVADEINAPGIIVPFTGAIRGTDSPMVFWLD